MKPRIDIHGKEVKVGDKVRGFGNLVCNGNFKIDLSPTVTANIQNEITYFDGLSASSFRTFEIVENPILIF